MAEVTCLSSTKARNSNFLRRAAFLTSVSRAAKAISLELTTMAVSPRVIGEMRSVHNPTIPSNRKRRMASLETSASSSWIGSSPFVLPEVI